MFDLACEHCGTHDLEELDHQGEHPGLCCDCFDLSCGQSLANVNEKRAEFGLPPLLGRPPLRKWGDYG